MIQKLIWLTVLCVMVPLAGCGGLVPNPDYESWEEFAPGSSVTFEGTKTINDFSQQVRITDTLKEINPNQLILERREELFNAEGEVISDVTGQVIEQAEIFGVDNVTTHPDTTHEELDAIQISIAGTMFDCEGQEYICKTGDVPLFGWLFGLTQVTTATLYTCPDIPGGLVRGRMETTKPEPAYSYIIDGQAVDFHVLKP
jgi:hypothetical protein